MIKNYSRTWTSNMPRTALKTCFYRLLTFFEVYFLFFFTFYFISEYSQLTMLWWFQVDCKGTQPYIYMYLLSPKHPSNPGCHITLSRVLCTTQEVLVGYPFLVYMSIPNSLTIPSTYPSLRATLSLFSKSVSLILKISSFAPFLFRFCI